MSSNETEAETSTRGRTVRGHSIGHATHHRHNTSSPPPAPIITKHSSIGISLPSPDFFGSIAGGGHYAGGLSPVRSESPELHKRHRRAMSASFVDPSVDDLYQEVMDDLKEMFCGRVTMEILRRRWKKDAVFEDPFTKSEGFDQYAPQWFALAKVFSECTRESARIMSATLSPNKLVYTQTQTYTIRWIGLKKTITSIVLVDLDDEFRVTRLVDQWNGEEPPTRWGTLLLRKMNAKVTPWLVRLPKQRLST